MECQQKIESIFNIHSHRGTLNIEFRNYYLSLNTQSTQQNRQQISIDNQCYLSENSGKNQNPHEYTTDRIKSQKDLELKNNINQLMKRQSQEVTNKLKMLIQNISQKKIDLRNSNIKKIKFKLISQFQQINFSNCLRSSTIQSSIQFSKQISENCKKLKYLNLSNNNIQKNFIQGIIQIINNLKQIQLSCIPTIDDSCVKLLSQNLFKCERIDISFTNITQLSLKYIKNIKNLLFLAMWIGSYVPNRYYEYFYQNKDKSKSSFNTFKVVDRIDTKVIDHLEGLYQMHLKQIIINLGDQDASKLILSLNNDCVGIEVMGKFNPQAIKKIQNLRQLKRLYINPEYPILKLSSKYLKSVSVINNHNKSILKNMDFLMKINIQKLRTLNISGQCIQQKKLEPILKFKQLSALNLSKVRTSAQFVVKLVGLQKLDWLDLSQNNITIQVLKYLFENLSQLKTLIIKNCKISNIPFTKNTKCLELHTLIACSNQLDDQGISMITQFYNLVTLDLYANNITIEGFKQILKLPKLYQFDIRSNCLPKDQVRKLIYQYKKLKHPLY